MLFLRSLLLTSIFGAGIAAVIWLVSLIPGNNQNTPLGVVLVIAFGMAWFWVYLCLKDRRLQSDQSQE